MTINQYIEPITEKNGNDLYNDGMYLFMFDGNKRLGIFGGDGLAFTASSVYRYPVE